MLQPLRIAFQFLTRFPVTASDYAPEHIGRSLLWYPAVGAMLGVALLLPALVFDSPLAAAGVAVLLWAGITGALHLDGLGDLADAWVGGHGDATRTMAIMKDAHAGPMAVSAIVVVLIAKFAALAALFTSQGPAAVFFAPILGRAAVPVVFLTTPYVRVGGLGSDMARHLPRNTARWFLAGIVALVLWALGWTGLAMLVAALIVAWGLGHACQQRIGGVTGDCLGALIELVEVAVLYAALM